MLEALNDDTITWTMSDEDLAKLRVDINAGDLGRAHIKSVQPVRSIGLVAAAA